MIFFKILDSYFCANCGSDTAISKINYDDCVQYYCKNCIDAIEDSPEELEIKNRVKSKFLEINPNAVSGTWLFWEVPRKSKVTKTIKVGDRFFIYEYQRGTGEDFSIEIG